MGDQEDKGLVQRFEELPSPEDKQEEFDRMVIDCLIRLFHKKHRLRSDGGDEV